MIRAFLALLLGYITAATLTTSVSFDLTATAWTSLWTYLAIGGSIVGWWVFFVVLFLGLAAWAHSQQDPLERYMNRFR